MSRVYCPPSVMMTGEEKKKQEEIERKSRSLHLTNWGWYENTKLKDGKD